MRPGDVARMELLLALSDLSNAPGASTTLSQMRSALSGIDPVGPRSGVKPGRKPGGKIRGTLHAQVHRRICGREWSGN